MRLPHFIVAGGRRKRFGSDKARHEVDGVPMVVSVAEAFDAFASATTVIAREAGAYDDLGLSTIADVVAGVGPMGGLLTALETGAYRHAAVSPSGVGWVLVSSCDLRRPKADWVERLLVHAAADVDVVVFTGDGFDEPFPGLYQARLSPMVRDAIGAGTRSFQGLFRRPGVRVKRVSLEEGMSLPLDLDRPPSGGGD